MTDNHTLLAFDALSEPPGIEIIDRVEQLRYQLHTPEPVSPMPIATAAFCFPVDKGIRVQTDELVLPSVVSVVVRDADGAMVTQIEHLESQTFESGSYILDLSTQIKSYIEVEGPVEITVDLCEIRFTFDEPTAVDIGFRSRHSRPAATVTTTADPVDMMAAVSTFGSALKSTSPERSFPTLRGHPPTVELGETLDIPAYIQSPETGIEIEVPATYESLYPVAPLAYYLGADVVPGPTPRLVTENGFEYAFDYPEGFERGVEQTLKQVFLLDCLTRTEGFYRVDLHERNALETYLPFDWETLYDQPIAERIESYLSVSYSVIDDYIPEWRLTAHVEPVETTIEQLPFVVDDLAVVRTPETTQTSVSEAPAGFSRSATASAGFTRSASPTSRSQRRSTTDPSPEDETYVAFDSTNSLEQAWIGEGIPIGASKLTADAFHNRLDREVTSGDITITIVVNDARMDEERDLVSNVYGDRDDLPFDVTVCRDLTVEELRAQLREECQFLHYIGHIDRDGFECTDGKLDAETLEETAVDAFLLNACNSHRQGLRLIEAGAIGGIVTLTDILNDGAVQIGETIARLLNIGFPLRVALTIAREESVLGGQYIVVGDGGMTVTQSPSGTSNMLEITPLEDGFAVDIQTYASDTFGLGSMYRPYLSDNNVYFLHSGKIETFHVTREELVEFLQLQEVPVRIGDAELEWSSSVSLDDVESHQL